MALTLASLEKARSIADLLAASPLPLPRSKIFDLVQRSELRTSSPITVYRWLAAAIQQGWAERQGEGPAAVYSPSLKVRAENARKHLAEPVGHRRKVGYNDEWVDAYIPNQTYYLSATSRERLHRRSPMGRFPIQSMPSRDLKLFMLDLSFASSKLEGNPYDYASTVRLFEEMIEMEGASKSDKIMLMNHYEALSFMVNNSSYPPTDNSVRVRAHDVRSLHALLSADLLASPSMCGALRQSHVEIGYSSYVPPDIPDFVKQRFDVVMSKAGAIEDPFEQAFYLLAQLPYLQPFEDCNKRTSRVACNIPLLRSGILPMSWMDTDHRDYISGVLSIYERNETALLEEIFVEGYLRATERFQLISRTREPEAVAVMYRGELRQYVRNRIINGDFSTPPGVSQEHGAEFLAYAEREIEALKDNPINGIRYGLDEDSIEAWTRFEIPAGEQPGRERCAA
jgi:fido (protein-threonine AMPylation protein)